MNRENFIENLILKTKEHLEIDKDIQIKADKRLRRCIARVDIYRYTDNDELFYLMFYNPNLINEMNKGEIIHIILHELGHIYKGHLEINKKDFVRQVRIQCEYEAEKLALEKVKEFYPKYYNIIIKKLRKYKDYKSIHGQAYERLLQELDNEKDN